MIQILLNKTHQEGPRDLLFTTEALALGKSDSNCFSGESGAESLRRLNRPTRRFTELLSDLERAGWLILLSRCMSKRQYIFLSLFRW